jgi:methionyl aminopeptidase
MIKYKTADEIILLRNAAQLVSKTLGLMAELVQPGVTPMELDKKAEEFILDHKANPGFKGLYNYPHTLCTSVNEQVVHGMPTERPLESGDVISIDCGVLMEGYYGDHAYTFEVGEVSEDVKKLLKVTKESLYLGIENLIAGNRIGDVANAIQAHAEKNKYGVVRELVGHGIGQQMHEKPEVPNYGKRGRGTLIREGLTVAIEPMVNMGVKEIRQLDDGWTIVTADGKPSAHFEHDVAVVNGRPEILSTFKYVEEVLGIPLTA